MRKYKAMRFSFWRAMAIVLAAPVALVTVGCGDASSKRGVNPFPRKTDERVIIKPHEKGEDIRYVTYWPDGLTVMALRVERKDGITEYSSFRHDGTRREAMEYFPRPKQEGEPEGAPVPQSSTPWQFDSRGRKLKSHATFGEDGNHLESLDRYREDGTRLLSGRRLSDGTFRTVAYQDDGMTLKTVSVYEKEGRLLNARSFHDDGARTASSTRGLPNGEFETTTYRPDGTTEKVAVKSSNGAEEVDFFAEDGKRRRMTVENESWYLTATYYRQDGEPDHSRKWNRAGDNMTVIKYVPGTGRVAAFGADQPAPYRQRYQQEWRKVTDADGRETWQLSSVTVYDRNGKMERKYIYHTDGYLWKIWFYTDGFNTHDKLFRSDGTLERIDYFEKGKGGVQRSENVLQEKGVKERVDKEFTRQLPYEDPHPYFTKLEVPPPDESDCPECD